MKKQITIAINAHGKELHNKSRLKIPPGMNVTIFSTAGKIGVCSLAQEYEDGTSFNEASIQLLKKNIPRLLQEGKSLHSILSSFLTDYRGAYQETIDEFLESEVSKKEILESDPQNSQEIRSLLKTIESDIEKAERARDSGVRVYTPTHNKEYSFYSHAFIDVVQHDDIGLPRSLTTMEFPDIISTFLPEDLRNFILDSIDKKGFISLYEIIIIYKTIGFEKINIIDFSCRDSSEMDQSLLDRISEEEKTTDVASGIKKKRKRSHKKRLYYSQSKKRRTHTRKNKHKKKK
jgi:hypothetical protein